MDWYDSSLKHVLDILDKKPVSINKPIHSEIEEDLLNSVSNLLTQLQPLQTSLTDLGANIKQSELKFSQLQNLTSQLSINLSPFASQLLETRRSRDEAESELATLDAVKQTLFVSHQDIQNLNKMSSELDEQFFKSFNQVKRIQSEAAPLLLAEHPKAGEELLMQTNKLLDDCYAKIYTAVLSGLQNQRGKEDLSKLKKHMALLSDRPIEFRQVLNSQSGNRKSKLAHAFHKRLAAEQVNAMVSPSRFVGSLLAFVHGEIVNEYEYIYTIVGDAIDNNNETTNIIVGDIIQVFETPLKRSLSTLALNMRDLNTLDECQGVLSLYTEMLAKFNQPQINSVLQYSNREFDKQFASIANELESWDARVDVAYKVLQNNVSGIGLPNLETKQRVELLLNDFLNTKLSLLDEKQDYITGLNMLDTAILKLTGFVVAETAIQRLKRLENDRMKKQILFETSELVKMSKLEEFKNGMTSVREFCIQFDEFLSSCNEFLNARLERINSPRVAAEINESSLVEFIRLYEEVAQPSMRSAESIRMLLL